MTNLNRENESTGAESKATEGPQTSSISISNKPPFRLTILSPARLHFGLLEVCANQPRLFGGIGAMIDQPSTQISLHVYGPENPAGETSGVSNTTERWSVEADEPWKPRMESVVRRWIDLFPQNDRPAFRIRLDTPPPMHAGLGSGTQVASATASLLNRWCRLDHRMSLEEMVSITQRGKRSFVGLAGHQSGGLIVDHGLDVGLDGTNPNMTTSSAVPGDPFDPLSAKSARRVDRYEIPTQWHAVLAHPLSTTSISGIVENDYFGQSQSPNPQRESMWKRIMDEILPAIDDKNLTRFGAALYEYGRDAGRVFAKVQGGIFRDQVVTSLIDWFRLQGVSASGQTSWGPTVYAILATQNEAMDLCERLKNQFPTGVEAMVTSFNNSGYRIDSLS